jgi:hypothetical protein
MIRRHATDATGQPAWLLITQPEHAGLAADIASAWKLDDVPAQLRSELIWTVAHHDDGWESWDRQPRLDMEGKPLDFREMAVEQSNPIWASSIEEARKHGPLAGYLVASHFLALRDAGTSASHPEVARFAALHQSQAEQDLEAARRQWGETLSDELVGALRDYVSQFDVLSLALCCRASRTEGEFELPVDAGARIEWLADDRLRLAPWPLRRDRLELVVIGQCVPARPYRDAQELKHVARTARVRWTMVAG